MAATISGLGRSRLPSELLLSASKRTEAVSDSMRRSRFTLILSILFSFCVAYSQSTPSAFKKDGIPGQAAPQQPVSPAEPAAEPTQPKTEILDSSATGGALVTDGHDPVLDPPPLPTGWTTLVGGVITGLDRVRNHMTVKVFAGGQWKVAFDERTHIFRNGAETTYMALKKGERVYVDTMLDPDRHYIFARNIRVGDTALPADAEGQIIDVDYGRGRLALRDKIDSSTVHFTVDQQTRIRRGESSASLNDVQPGALAHITFSPQHANRGVAREITIIALPGSAFTFVGTITHLDMHRGLLAVQNATDNKNYEIFFTPASLTDKENLAIGAEVKVVAVFEGPRYTARAVTLTKAASQVDDK